MALMGFDTRDLFFRASKTLLAGAVGVGVGYGVTLFLTLHGITYAVAAWPGYGCGFLANFATQVKMRNIIVKRA